MNRVSGGIPSEIFGALEANGRVFLVNPAGVLFSPSAQVNVGGLIASTLDITQDDFLSGQYIFGGSARTAVDNQGSISVSNGGLAAFIGAQIDNSGTITAKDGSVLMGAGSRVKVNVDGSLYSLEIQADAVDGLVNQDGIIQANNGRIWLSAGAAADLKSNAINHTGISRANSLQVGPKGEIVLSSNGHVNISGGSELSVAGQEAGKININADTAMLGGVLVASSTGNGVAAGEIELKFEGRLNISGQLQASSDTGKGGFIGVTSGQIIQSASSELNVDGAAGGYIRMDAGAGLLTSGDYTAHGHVSSGGMIDITGSDLRFFSATLNASGQSVGGMVRLGGAFQGGKDVDPDTSYYSSFIGRWGALPSLGSSQQTFINNATQIDTSSAAGVGGTAIIWSDDTTTFLGKIDSQGSTGGGSVEISSANDLRKASLANVDVGDGGHLLLDPKNIIIGDSATAQDWSYAGILGFGYSTTTKNLDVSGLDASGSFGMVVSLNAAGDRMAVGSHSDNGSGDDTNYAGAVYLFSFTDSDFSGGALQATIGKGYTGGKNVDVSAIEANDYFGRSVSLNAAGDRLAAGSNGNDGSGNGTTNSGAVYLFSFTDSDFSGGTHEATLGKGYTGGKNVDVSGLEAEDMFGVTISLNAAGDRLAVGAHKDDGSDNGTTLAGAAYLFSFTDSDFSGGALQATIGKGYTGGKNVDVSALAASDNFGSAVSLNAAGDRLAVGAHGDDGSDNGTSGAGAAYLFSFTDSDFSGGALQATIGKGYTGGKNVNVSALEATEYFGTSVSLNAAGDRLALGATHDDGSDNGTTQAGAVYLFSFTDSAFSGGALQATIGKGYTGGKNVDLSAIEASDFFGRSLSLNAAGDRLVVGANGDDGSGNSTSGAGAVYLFSFTDSDFSSGALQATIGKGYTGGKNIDVSTLEEEDNIGRSLSLNAAGDRLAVGFGRDDGSDNGTSGAGAAYLFSFTDSNFSGGALQAIIGKGYTGGKNVDLSALEADDTFGRSVSLNAAGDRLAVASQWDEGFDNGTAQAGAVYLFSFTDSDFSGGALQATIGKGYTGSKNVDVSAIEANDWFGRWVSLNAVGDRLAVGAYGDDGSGNSETGVGAVYLFSFTDSDFSGGALQATIGDGYTGGKNIHIPQLRRHDNFGMAVSLNAVGDRLAVGIQKDDGYGNVAKQSGGVYLFSFTDSDFSGGALQAKIGKGFTGGKNIDVSALEEEDLFGHAVSLNAAGDRLAVGAYSDDGSGNSALDAGAVYLFSFTDSDFSGGTHEATFGKGYTGGKNVDVSGLEAGDGFSRSVSLNAAGNRLAAGAAGDDGSGNGTYRAGAVYLFTSSAETGSYNAESAASFTAHADQGITVSAADLRSRLGPGQNVIFQASNDITLSSDLMVVGSGTGGSLTLRAGRSILLNADMVTNNGDLNLIANDTLANGVVDAHRDTGNAVITMSAGKSINAGTGAVSITLLDGAGKTNLANGDISLRDITAGTITAVNSGSTSGTGITLSSGALTASSSGDAIALSAQKFTNSAGASALSAASGRWLVWSSNADPFDGSTGDTIGGLSYDFRQYNATYDSTAAAQSTGNGFLYTLAPSLSSSLLGSLTKSYDGLASISTLEAGNYSTITGVIGGDTISLTTPATAALNSKEVGNNKYTSVTRAKDSWTNGSIAVYGYQIALSSGNITSITIPTNSGEAFIVSSSGIASRPIIANSATGMGASDTQYGLAGDQISTVSGSAFQTVKILMDIAKPQKCRIGSGFDLICGNSQNISYQRSVQR